MSRSPITICCVGADGPAAWRPWPACGRSGPAIREVVRGGATAITVPDDDAVSLGWCHELVASGDPALRQVIVDAGRAMGRMVGYLQGALDIHDIVLIGTMTEFGDLWLDAVRLEARRTALALLVDETRIGLGNLGSDVVELGAAALLMTAELGLSQAA